MSAADLTPSLPQCHLKIAIKCAKFETHKPFCFLFRTVMGIFFIKMHSIESRCIVGHMTRKYTVCRRICTSFSLKILQAGAVKGLRLVRGSENRAHQREGRSRKGRQRRKTAKRGANRKKKKISTKRKSREAGYCQSKSRKQIQLVHTSFCV